MLSVLFDAARLTTRLLRPALVQNNLNCPLNVIKRFFGIFLFLQQNKSFVLIAPKFAFVILIFLARIYYLCQQHHVVATGASSEEPAHAQARPVGHLLDKGLVVLDCGQELVSFVLALPVGDYGVLGGDEVLEVPPIRACTRYSSPA